MICLWDFFLFTGIFGWKEMRKENGIDCDVVIKNNIESMRGIEYFNMKFSEIYHLQ